MLVLAVDASSDRLKIGLADEQQIVASFDRTVDRNHAEKMIPLIDRVLTIWNVDPSRIDLLAVPHGPGSFTGLRVGIATVLGLAQAWQKEILTASNMDMEKAFSEHLNRNVLHIVHCRGDEFYYLDEAIHEVRIESGDKLLANFPHRQFGGAGVPKLERIAEANGIKLSATLPHSFTGGMLARLFASGAAASERLDPTDLDINYFLKSQPEQKREAAKDWRIVEMTEADLTDILRIENDSFSDPWDKKSFRADISSDHIITLSVKIGDSCVGYLSCIALDDYAYIANIAIGKEYRSRGIGRGLLEELRRRLVPREIKLIVLDVRTSNQSAIQFYEKYGFTVLIRRKGFYTNPPEDSFTMQFNAGS